MKFVRSQRPPELCARVARKREETVSIIHNNLVMLQRWCTKFSMKRTNLFCSIGAVVVQDFVHLLDPKLFNETKTAQETIKRMQKFVPPERSQG